MRPLIAGNWKMNGLGTALSEIDAVARAVAETRPSADIAICPPATLVARAVAEAKGRIAIGGQDCHAQSAGAFTGDISAEMLKDAGAEYVIVGHSERRAMHHESDADVEAKAVAAGRAGLKAIICVGETEAERDAGHALSVVAGQLGGSVPKTETARSASIAYEPIWAIGTGKTPTASQVAEMHAHIHATLERLLGTPGRGIRVLYGGSVKPANAREILAISGVEGALVGGASLKATEFCAIFAALPTNR